MTVLLSGLQKVPDGVTKNVHRIKTVHCVLILLYLTVVQ